MELARAEVDQIGAGRTSLEGGEGLGEGEGGSLDGIDLGVGGGDEAGKKGGSLGRHGEGNNGCYRATVGSGWETI